MSTALRRASALAAVTLLVAAVVALAVATVTETPRGEFDPYAPSYLVTTAETPARWAILDNGVSWVDGHHAKVVCVLNTPTGRVTRDVPIPLAQWATTSPMAWTPGANCPG